MNKVEPYKTINEALLSLDNGGRFYHVLTKADDGIISQAELGKIAGRFSDKQKMVLFLELATSRLESTDKEILISKLDERLQEAYLKYRPQNLLPSEVNEKGLLSSNIILTGVPKLIDSKSDFSGFIMVPLMVGDVMTFSMIPIIDDYDVYELRDEESSESFIIAHTKDPQKLPNQKIIIAGVLKELSTDKNEKNGNNKFVEALYHITDLHAI